MDLRFTNGVSTCDVLVRLLNIQSTGSYSSFGMKVRQAVPKPGPHLVARLRPGKRLKEEALWRELAEEIEFKRSMILAYKFVQKTILADGEVTQYVFHLYTQVDVSKLVLHKRGGRPTFDENELFTLPFAFNIEQVYRDHLSG